MKSAGAALSVVLVGIGLLAAACGGPSEAQVAATATPQPATIVPGVASVASPTPEALVLAGVAKGDDAIEDRPLVQLSPYASMNAQLFGDSIAVAVCEPKLGVMYTLNGDQPFILESVAKLPIMLTLLDQVTEQGRALTAGESSLLSAMITESDNDAADALFAEVGGASAIKSYLASIGIDGSGISATDWGDSEMSASEAARLMGMLIDGDILDAQHQELAMNLLEDVDSAQAWGVVDSVSYATTGVKDGWYPERDGWVIDSVGYAVGSLDYPDYVVAVFTNQQTYFYDTVDSIHTLGQLIQEALGTP